MTPELIKRKRALSELKDLGTALQATSDVAQHLLTDRGIAESPGWVANDFYLGGIIQANQLLSARLVTLADELGVADEA
ncbi:hypothetical protein CF392_16210 [Tamilnaduibacter salinus]|uniref:Uncharacterized protein n=1 Tax=Tamilnaduibacter salinus TaxID=1484056 RepID=A0A2A2HYP2_9GAMM|nr:hypothetical protein [Tamilnaduibacter salinus]PAV24451.1 hypothetical protein CF392_16210 [Tamilnaduibacter salinus]